MKDLVSYKKFAFVFAHPDDEIFTAVTIRNLVRANKEVYVMYLTNGDYMSSAMGEIRKKELQRSMKLMNVKPTHLILLNFSERPLFENAGKAIEEVARHIKEIDPDCIIGHDYEGGHDGHDLASFCAHLAANEMQADFWVFPAYNSLPDVRRWNHFIPGRTMDYRLQLSEYDRKFKLSISKAHASQKEYFGTILDSSDANDFLSRDVLCFAGDIINYRRKPSEPIGYDLPGSTTRFDVLHSVVNRHL